MALFGGSRDISLFHNLNKELINDIIQTEVAYYKFALEQTTSNVYGESMGKMFYEPVRIACLIDRNDQQWAMMDTMLKSNGNKVDHSAGFQAGKNGMPSKNPYEMDIGGEKEDLTWLIK